MAKSMSKMAVARQMGSQKLKLCMCTVEALAKATVEMDQRELLSEPKKQQLIEISESFNVYVRGVFGFDDDYEDDELETETAG